MNVFTKTQGDAGLWWVYCHQPAFHLGPFPSKEMAFEIRNELVNTYLFGREEVQSGLRELIGAAKHVGD